MFRQCVMMQRSPQEHYGAYFAFAANFTVILDDYEFWQIVMLYCIPGLSKVQPAGTLHVSNSYFSYAKGGGSNTSITMHR